MLALNENISCKSLAFYVSCHALYVSHGDLNYFVVPSEGAFWSLICESALAPYGQRQRELKLGLPESISHRRCIMRDRHESLEDAKACLDAQYRIDNEH